MEKNKNKVKTIKLNSKIKNQILKDYEVRNKMNNNFDVNENFQKFSYDNEKNPNFSLNNNEKEVSYSNSKVKYKEKFLQNNFNSMNNINIQYLSKIKRENHNNILNKLFFTTSNIFNQKYIKNRKPQITLNNLNNNLNDIKEKSKILNKLFPDINEINKYSNLPFFSLIKAKSPYKMKLNQNNKKNAKIKFPQEEFLYKISHNFDEDEKINYNFNKNKGIKKGRTTKYFHGVNKFCINNKISETNFIKKEDLNKRKIKLELDIENLTKGGEKIPQISTKEKHIKILENNLNKIKSIPNQLFNDLEDDVFKYIDEELDNTNNENSKNNDKKKNEEVNTEQSNLNTNMSNIINLSTQFKMNNSSCSDKILETSKGFKNKSKYNSYKSYFNDSNNLNFSGFKKPQQYPINFYSTQQLKIKEHFNKTYKNTFDERKKQLKKENNSERFRKKMLSNDAINDLLKKKIISNKFAYKKESKIRDIIIGHKLRCEFSPVDIKRILNGLKPWVDIKSDEENYNKIHNIKDNNVNFKDK